MRGPDMRLGALTEKREYARFFLDLPLEFQIKDLPDTFGGIVIDGSEGGFLIHSRRDLPLGTRLDISVFFPDGFELADFHAVGQILRKIPLEEGEQGYRYGLKIVEIDAPDRRKLRHTLSGLYDFGNMDAPILPPKL
jgi:hypothetical protein